nr:disease resistance protein At4g27190-like [Quercus suber]
MNFRDKIEEKIFDWVLVALLAPLGFVLAALGYSLRYLICYKSNVDNLKTQVEELLGARDRLKHDVDTARSNLMKIEDDVKRQLTESDDIIAVAEKILEFDNMGRYPNMMSRFQVSRRAEKAAWEAENLKDEIIEILKFNRVGYRESTRVGGTAISNRGYESFESRRLILTDVLEALKNPNITRIGLYGMGGIGKTMLVKEVLKQAERYQLFDKYLFVVVSNPPDLKKIQREIAEKLGLKLEGEITESVLADRLCERLKQENRVLMVLDDIWKYLDLEALGIFFGDDQNGCKLLLTSRLQNILRDFMDAQTQFPVGVLSDDEAISLFEKIVGNLAKTGEFKSNMHQIVKECAGLPIAITTVANALKNKKNIYVWKDALNKLKMSCPIKIEGMDEVYRSIKLSYDFLESDAKSLLSLCSLHREDNNIEVEDLLKYGVGLDLFHIVRKIEDARCRVHALVEELKDSCFLLDGNYNGTVKMHAVIRDVVINIAVEERHMFTIRTAIELQNLSKREDAVAISLPYINDDLELPNQFECSKLKLLLLFRQKVGFRIPDSFFEGLKDLKVLKLSRSWSGVLPSSLSSLENLQTLCLDGEVQNAIIIGELKNLKALSLSLSDTERLPQEIGQLTHLQLLDLRGCSRLQFIPPNVLSNLKRLEELYLPDDVEWEVEVQSTEKINAMVSELDHLSHLTKLHIRIENAKILPNAMVFERLESYRIAIGSASLRGETLETSRILKLKISFQSDNGYKVLFRKCENLILDEMKGVKNNLYELDSEGFQSLKHLTVQHNDEIQYICMSMGVLDSVFPSLESITLRNVNNLERICYTQLSTKTFCNLRVVKVSKCCKLESVFSSSMVGSFIHLQEMNIKDCEIMSAIVAIEREEEIEVNSDDNIMFENLHSLKLRKLFKLKGFLSVVDSLVLFNGKVVFPNLEELEIKGMDSMKMIWSNQLISDCFITFAKLCTIKIWHCSSLKSVFPTTVAQALKQLENLMISNCAVVEEIVAKEEGIEEGIERTTLFEFPQLKTLTLEELPELKSFYPGNHTLEWPSLKSLCIKKCDKLKIFGSNKSSVEETNGLNHHASLILQPLFFVKKDKFPNLEYLRLDEGDVMNETCGGPSEEFCCNLKELRLYGNGEIPNVEAPRAGISDFCRLKNIVPFSSTFFHSLKKLEVYKSDVLISLLTPSTARTLAQLQFIVIGNCKRMTEIVANEGSEAEAGDEIAFNNLTNLRFYNAPSLTAFHLGNRTIKFPSLDEVIIAGCPKLKIFYSGVLSTPKLTRVLMEVRWMAFKKEGDGDVDLNARIKEYWEGKLETCDQKFAEKTDASEGGESEHDANDDLERETTSEVGDTQCDGE